jgi:hypothetical protein
MLQRSVSLENVQSCLPQIISFYDITQFCVFKPIPLFGATYCLRADVLRISKKQKSKKHAAEIAWNLQKCRISYV